MSTDPAGPAPVTGATRLAAVIGSPVGHSLSPALHNAAFAAGRLDWRFVAFDVAPGAAGAAIAAMRTLGIGGFAVTMPHKAAAATSVDDVDPAAAALGSVNTVVLRPDGTTFGASTDGAGFVDWAGVCGWSPVEARVVVFGAGGAGRAIVDALGRAGAADVAIVNRTAAAARAAARLTPAARVGAAGDVARADLVVNATSVGMAGTEAAGALPFDAGLLRPGLTVADIVYHPLDTPLLRAATAAGCGVVDGLGMLVYQAVRQQELWTGTRPDPAALRAAAEAQLADRR